MWYLPVPDDLPTAYRDSSVLAVGAMALGCACLRCLRGRISAAHEEGGSGAGRTSAR